MALTNLAGINDRLRFATRGESLLKVFIQNSLFSFQNITFRILLFIYFTFSAFCKATFADQYMCHFYCLA